MVVLDQIRMMLVAQRDATGQLVTIEDGQQQAILDPGLLQTGQVGRVFADLQT